jgi:hypothetical protein
MSEDDSERLEKVKAIFFQVQQAVLVANQGQHCFLAGQTLCLAYPIIEPVLLFATGSVFP